MSQGSTASSLLRVTVASATRRVDLVLPGSVPLAELLPELARSVGLLDPSTVYAGYRVVTADGRELVEDGGLIIQGVEDGGLLTVSARVDDETPAGLRRRRRGDDRRGRARPAAVGARGRPAYRPGCGGAAARARRGGAVPPRVAAGRGRSGPGGTDPGRRGDRTVAGLRRDRRRRWP